MPADSSAVASVTSAVSSLASERVVDPNVADPAAYGFAPGLIEVTLTAKDGKKSKLLIGDNTPSGSGVYAKLDGDPRLFTMPTVSKGAFDKEAKDFRDKRLLPVTSDKSKPHRGHCPETDLRIREEGRRSVADREAQGHAGG